MEVRNTSSSSIAVEEEEATWRSRYCRFPLPGWCCCAGFLVTLLISVVLMGIDYSLYRKDGPNDTEHDDASNPIFSTWISFFIMCCLCAVCTCISVCWSKRSGDDAVDLPTLLPNSPHLDAPPKAAITPPGIPHDHIHQLHQVTALQLAHMVQHLEWLPPPPPPGQHPHGARLQTVHGPLHHFPMVELEPSAGMPMQDLTKVPLPRAAPHGPPPPPTAMSGASIVTGNVNVHFLGAPAPAKLVASPAEPGSAGPSPSSEPPAEYIPPSRPSSDETRRDETNTR